MQRSRWQRLFNPNSLVNRTLLLTVLAVVLAQGLAMSMLYSESKQQELQGIRSVSSNMAGMFASTVTFFQSLPVRYRHIILDQVRNMGGTRFFVSINREKLIVEPIANSELKQAAIDTVSSVLEEKLNRVKSIHVEFSKADRLRLMKNDIFLSDLPKSWAYQTLTIEPLKPPILVVQIELTPYEWIYIASLLPAPYMNLTNTVFAREQWVSLGVSTIILLMLTFFLMRRQVRPIRNLARAADEMSMSDDLKPLKEEGAEEVVTATRAFNRMRQRIRRYVSDREQLFSSISHDLKTPITRLRLRTELLESDRKREKFTRDLDDLEMMVKGALQCVRDTDLHENNELIDIDKLLVSITEDYNMHHHCVSYSAKRREEIIGKPLAIKRVLTNLIDNGVKYGRRVEVRVFETDSWLIVQLNDDGPGIPVDKLESVFEPYFRIANDDQGHGLGLGICRNILHGHGGDIVLKNAPQGGLEVKVYIPLGLEI